MQQNVDATWSAPPDVIAEEIPADEAERPSAPPFPRTARPRADRVLMSARSHWIDVTAVIVPFIIFLIGVIGFWGTAMNWTQFAIMIAMYQITGFGVTIGYHRLFTHRAFETPRWMRLTLAVLGSLSVQGPLLWWVAVHRKHHHFSDEPGDPHSPHLHEGGRWGAIGGAFHSHVGWLFKQSDPGLAAYVPDLLKDRALERISDAYPLWVFLSVALPALAGGLLTRSWHGALLGGIWGGVVRVFMVHHITWSVNSVCHLWGKQPFRSHDHSRNNWVVGVFALGEGWHNNHHAFPTSARHGIGWWQPDVSYMLIWCMEKLGLATRVKVPSPRAIAAKRDAAA